MLPALLHVGDNIHRSLTHLTRRTHPDVGTVQEHSLDTAERKKKKKTLIASEVFHCEPWIHQGHCCVTHTHTHKKNLVALNHHKPQHKEIKSDGGDRRSTAEL